MKGAAVYALIMAAGGSARMGRDKLRAPLSGIPVLVRTVRAFRAVPRVSGIGLVVPAGAREDARAWLAAWDAHADLWAEGGAARQDSVMAGLEALPAGCAVLVHDGARPLVTADLIERCIQSVVTHGSGVAVLPAVDALHRVSEGRLTPEDRTSMVHAHTPQAFWRDELLEAYAKARGAGCAAPDDASVMAAFGGRAVIATVASSPRNVKITYPEDLAVCEALLGAPRLRVGHGYDAHRLAEGRRLILCGVEIPHDRGLDGHSDADVATHALIDAMLGAVAMGDIGTMFPDGDARYAGISSLILLREAHEAIRRRGGELLSADLSVVAQAPRLSGWIGAMRQALARALDEPVSFVSIKATTTEGMGFEGRGEGISAHAVAAVRCGGG